MCKCDWCSYSDSDKNGKLKCRFSICQLSQKEIIEEELEEQKLLIQELEEYTLIEENVIENIEPVEEKLQNVANEPVTVEKVAEEGVGNAVETVEKVEVVETVEKPKPEFDLDVMTSDEIREWAKANGYGGIIKNTRNKEKLIELLNGVI